MTLKLVDYSFCSNEVAFRLIGTLIIPYNKNKNFILTEPIVPQKSKDNSRKRNKKNHNCVKGSEWMVGCNWCSCANGIARCTMKACAPG